MTDRQVYSAPGLLGGAAQRGLPLPSLALPDAHTRRAVYSFFCMLSEPRQISPRQISPRQISPRAPHTGVSPSRGPRMVRSKLSEWPAAV